MAKRPLDEYHRKRDFTKTPEPTGDTHARDRQQPFFCVQKHLASHLHYDFRLEHNGVLLSWAVPKGPSLDPKTKRLAMQTEDHPLDYGEFEGVIPEGYGAGIVMLWDRGSWTPETPDVGAALRKGDLKFTLNGYKLKGSWVLVRTSGRFGGGKSGATDRAGRSWLLIKHRDEWSGELDITAFAPRSVKSDGDFEDILASDTPAIWESHRPASGGTAGTMLAEVIARAARLKGATATSAETTGTPAAARKRSARSTPSTTTAATGKKPAASSPSPRKTVRKKAR